MKKVALIGKSNLRSDQVTNLHSKCTLTKFDTNVSNGDVTEVIRRIGNNEIILVNAFTPITKFVLNECYSLRSIISCSAGIDHIDLEETKKIGIEVKWYPSYCARTVAEKSFCYILMSMNSVMNAIDNVRSGKWDYLSFQGRELNKKKIAIFGYGETGKHVGLYAKSFGMNVFVINSKTPQNDVHKIISESDVISVHMSLSPSTIGYFDEEKLSLMKEDVVFINTARGKLVDQNSFVSFFRKNAKAKAVLDVLEEEPPCRTDPILSLNNVLITPHIGWNSQESDNYLAESIFNDLLLAIKA